MPSTFTPNTPQASHFPANDQPLMNANNQYLQEFGTRDHQFTLLGAVNSTDGTHKQVTLTNEAAPGFTGANSVLFANTANGASQLFFQNANGTMQLTASVAGVPVINVGPPNEGATFLPGGLLLQYGFQDTAVTGFTVTYPKAFNAAATIAPVVNITVELAIGPVPTSKFAVVVGTPSNTTFAVQNNAGGNFTFMWTAIGQA